VGPREILQSDEFEVQLIRVTALAAGASRR
jgi:hypothetical protein